MLQFFNSTAAILMHYASSLMAAILDTCPHESPKDQEASAV